MMWRDCTVTDEKPSSCIFARAMRGESISSPSSFRIFLRMILDV